MLPHHRRRNGASAGLALLVWLAVAALLHAPGTPPVYDGIATPPEPYRWVSPPPSLACSNQAPLVGRATFAVPNVQFAGGLMLTGDNQVVLTFGPASLQAVAGSTSIACTIEPLARPPAGPAGAQIRGNVYRLACVSLPGSTGVPVDGQYVVRLRYPPGPFDHIQFYDGHPWHPLAITRDLGGNPWARASVSALGDVAATAPLAGLGESILPALQQHPALDALLALVMVFGVVALVLEIRRRRKPA